MALSVPALKRPRQTLAAASRVQVCLVVSFIAPLSSCPTARPAWTRQAGPRNLSSSYCNPNILEYYHGPCRPTPIPADPSSTPRRNLHITPPNPKPSTSTSIPAHRHSPPLCPAAYILPSTRLFPSLLPRHSSASQSPSKQPLMPMASMSASSPYSPSNSDISTPRSSSPSSSTGRTSLTNYTNKRMSISSSRRISHQNPMSSVDIQAIEAAMRAQQLDQLRGYRQDTYGSVKQIKDNQYVTDVAKHLAVGQQVLREPTFNKGSFSPQIKPLSSPFFLFRTNPADCISFRSCLYSRRACDEEPDWFNTSHHGRLEDTMPACSANDPLSPDQCRQIPLLVLCEGPECRPVLPPSHGQRKGVDALGLHTHHW